MKYTLEADRLVTVNGSPIFIISPPQVQPDVPQPSPIRLDNIAKRIVFLLNEYAMVEEGFETPHIPEEPGSEEVECPSSPDGKHSNTRGVGTFGVYQCRHCHKETNG